ARARSSVHRYQSTTDLDFRVARHPTKLRLGCSSERYRLLRRSMRTAIRVALTYSLNQRGARTRHAPRERTCLLRPVVLEARAGLQEPSCTACIRRIQALRI